jgi:hypothetical protein
VCDAFRDPTPRAAARLADFSDEPAQERDLMVKAQYHVTKLVNQKLLNSRLTLAS